MKVSHTEPLGIKRKEKNKKIQHNVEVQILRIAVSVQWLIISLTGMDHVIHILCGKTAMVEHSQRKRRNTRDKGGDCAEKGGLCQQLDS